MLEKFKTQLFQMTNDVCLEFLVGFTAWGLSGEDSDKDYMAIVVPPAEILFPGSYGKILGWDYNKPLFEGYEYTNLSPDDYPFLDGPIDLRVFSIVKFLRLCLGGNPGVIDAIMSDESNITLINPAGNMLLQNRKMFITIEAVRKQVMFANNMFVNSTFCTKPTGSLNTKLIYLAARALSIGKQLANTCSVDKQKVHDEVKKVMGLTNPKDMENAIQIELNNMTTLLKAGTTDLPLQADEAKVRDLLEAVINCHYSAKCVDIIKQHAEVSNV